MSDKARFQDWFYSLSPPPWKRFDTADEVGFFVWKQQQDIIDSQSTRIAELEAIHLATLLRFSALNELEAERKGKVMVDAIRITQILVAPEDSTYQGCLLGLGSDGIVYFSPKGEAAWDIYIPNKFLAAKEKV